MADLRRLRSLPLRRSLGEHVYENLKQAIVRGNLAPGSRLVESHVAEALRISRTPVREAIHKLEREGLLRKSPRGGLFVVGLTRAEIQETFGIRGVLESYAARLATVNHREQELEPLEEKIRQYRQSLERGLMHLLPGINTEFHDLLYALSRSPRLVKMINDLREQIFRFRQVILENERWARISNEDHQAILYLIKKREVEAVERMVQEHMRKGEEFVLQEFDMHHL